MKKNSRGFTLVELLVVIAIMGSILVLAITSLNSISKAKKNEARKKVENQIELAAKQYFEANEYKFDWLQEDGVSATFPLKYLIEEDYINTLTNPVTGKKYDKCSYIEVTKKKKNKYLFKYNENNNNCEETSEYVFGGNVSLAISKECSNSKGKNGWCIGIQTLTATAKSKDDTIKSLVACSNQDCGSALPTTTKKNQGTEKTIVYSDNKSNSSLKNIYFKVETNGDLNKTKSETYKIDNVFPSLFFNNENYIAESNNAPWLNKQLYDDGNRSSYRLNYYDNHSGVSITDSILNDKNNGDTITYNNDGKHSDKYKVCDNAGNCTDKTAYANVDITPPTLEIKDLNNYKRCGGSNFDVQYFTSKSLYNNANTSKINVFAQDLTSGVDGEKLNQQPKSFEAMEAGSSAIKEITVYDKAGNSSSLQITLNSVECDTTPPKITVQIYKRDKNGNNSGTAVISKDIQGNDISKNTILVGSWPSWVNMYNYPYGINIVYKSNEYLKTSEWTWNKAYLNRSASESSDYNWNSTNKLYNGVDSNSKVIRNDVAANTTISYGLAADGFREGRIYAYDKVGNETIILIKMAKDSTGPVSCGKDISGVIMPQTPKYYTSNAYCSKYNFIHTAFKTKDSLSGIKRITHYMGRDLESLYYNNINGGFISLENGAIKKDKNWTTIATKSNQIKEPIRFKNGWYELSRAWADTYSVLSASEMKRFEQLDSKNRSDSENKEYKTIVNKVIKAANNIGCGTVGSEIPDMDAAQNNKYCNYFTVEDWAGNKLTGRFCRTWANSGYTFNIDKEGTILKFDDNYNNNYCNK